MDVQFLGYGVFIAVIIGLIMGFPSWQIRLVEAIIVVASGVLTEHEATATISWWSGLHLWAICWPPRCLGRSLYEAEDILASDPPDGPGPSLPLPTGSSGRHTPPSPWIPLDESRSYQVLEAFYSKAFLQTEENVFGL